MKKRSVLSAVAMLLVSAIVLTSATYAWFASNNAADLTAVSASVANSDGSILVSADGGSTWKTTVAMGDPKTAGGYGDFTASSLLYPNITTSSGGELTPVSCTPDSGAATFMSGSLNGTAFSSSPVNAGFVQATILVKSSVATTITVDPNFTTNFNYGYCYFVVEGTGYVYGVGPGRTYTPIGTSATPVTGVDSNANAIMDTNDSSYPSLGTAVTTVGSGSTYNITAVAGTSYTITIYMWAEGNDIACTGTTSGQISCAVHFSKTAATTV